MENLEQRSDLEYFLKNKISFSRCKSCGKEIYFEFSKDPLYCTDCIEDPNICLMEENSD